MHVRPVQWIALRLPRLAHVECSLFAAFVAATLPSCMLMESKPPQMGEITIVQGNVFLARVESMHPEAVTQSHPLYAQDVLESQPLSGAQISLDSHAHLILGPNSRVTFYERAEDGHTIVMLDRGTLRLQVRAESEDVYTVQILAGGSSAATHHGDVTVWVQEDLDEQATWEPGTAAIRSVGAVNHGTQGVVTFDAMGRSIVIHPGYLSVTAPDHPPAPAIAIEGAKPFVTDIVDSTNLALPPNDATAIGLPVRPAVKRTTETVAQRACKDQKEKALRMKPSVDQTKARLTHCL